MTANQKTVRLRQVMALTPEQQRIIAQEMHPGHGAYPTRPFVRGRTKPLQKPPPLRGVSLGPGVALPS